MTNSSTNSTNTKPATPNTKPATPDTDAELRTAFKKSPQTLKIHRKRDIVLLLIAFFAVVLFNVGLLFGLNRLIANTAAEQSAAQTDPALITLADADYAAYDAPVEITAAEFESMREAGETFVVMAVMTTCPAEAPLTDTVNRYLSTRDLRIYHLSQSEFKASSLKAEIKYLPTLAIIENGELKAFLNAESDADLPAYKDPDDLHAWLAQYLNLRD